MTSPFTDEELQRIADGPKFAGAADLARELLEARRDARRYQALRSHWVSFYPADRECSPDLPVWYKCDALDDEIDDALAEGK